MSRALQEAYEAAGMEFGAFPKTQGDVISASLTFKHKGPAETLLLSWGLMPADRTPGVYHDDRIRWVATNVSLSVGADSVLKTYTRTLTASFPAPPANWWDGLLLGNQGIVDCYVAVASSRKVELSGHWDDVYEVPTVQEYRDLEATFS